MTDTTATAPAEPASLADLAEIFYAPSAVFARRRDGQFGMALLVIVIIGGIIAFATASLTAPAMRADMLRGMQPAIAAGKMTADQAAATVATGTKFAAFGGIVFYIVVPFVAGVVIWLAGLLSGARVAAGAGVMIATFAMLPRIVGMVAGAVMAMILPEPALTSAGKLTLSPAQFVDAVHHPGLTGLLVRFDVFVLWSYVIIAIGVRVAGRSTRSQAWITAAIAWLILSLPAVYSFVKLG